MYICIAGFAFYFLVSLYTYIYIYIVCFVYVCCHACKVVLNKKQVILGEQEDVPNRGYHMADAAEGFVAHLWNVKQGHDPDCANMIIKTLKETIHGETTMIPVLVNDKVIQADSMLEWYRPVEAAVGGKANGKAKERLVSCRRPAPPAKKARTSR